jgi:hypothetical protein
MLLPGDSSNPILHVEELPRFPWRRPRPLPGAVHVYLSRHDRLYQPPGGLTSGELWLLGPRRLYVVDVSPHNVVRSMDVVSPSTGTAVGLAVTFRWRIRDPRFVVESSLVDVMAVIPEVLRVAVTEALANLVWGDAQQLAGALRPGVLPERVNADGVELSGLSAEVLSLDDGSLAQRGGDA